MFYFLFFIFIFRCQILLDPRERLRIIQAQLGDISREQIAPVSLQTFFTSFMFDQCYAELVQRAVLTVQKLPSTISQSEVVAK